MDQSGYVLTSDMGSSERWVWVIDGTGDQQSQFHFH